MSKRKTVPKTIFPLCCRLSIQSAIVDGFNSIIQEGYPIEEMGFLTKELRDIADQLDELIEREKE